MTISSGSQTPKGPLAGLRVLDLTRILAGPSCTQLFGDLGADILKIERPGAGDDTRKWGPPYVKDGDGNDTGESAYYLCANRNKRSLSVDISNPEGAKLVQRLLGDCDILVENFKVGGLKKYGLAYDDLKDDFPGLIYCSISGFGQTGPYAPRAGYDYMVQGMGGIMSLTGEPDGDPMKVGVAIADLMCGMYASTAILAALHHKNQTGEGQFIDIGLADTQVAWLANEGTNYLTTGKVPERRGNAHPNIVPYEMFPSSDGYFILAVGNNAQFERFCAFAGVPDWTKDERFNTNSARTENRASLSPMIRDITQTQTTRYWLDGLTPLGVPCGPINDLQTVFNDPHFLHRGMRVSMDHPASGSGKVELIGNPLQFSRTPVEYRHAPPMLGEHTDEVLSESLGLDRAERNRLKDEGVI